KVLSIEMGFTSIVPILIVINNVGVEDEVSNIKDRMLLDFSIYNILEEILKEEHQGMVISLQENEFVLLVSFQNIVSEHKISTELNKLVNRSSFCFKKFLSVSANFYLGHVTNFSNIEKEFIKLNEKRKEEFLDVKNHN